MDAFPRLQLSTHPHRPSHPPPTGLPPIDSIHDITGTEKIVSKPAAFKYK